MKSIIFNAEMVRAILDGKKTVTRRPIKLIDFMASETKGYDWEFRDKRLLWNSISTQKLLEKYAPYRPGETVYVKETWYCDNPATAEDVMSRGQGLFYRSGMEEWEEGLFVKQWKCSIHMPEWAARIHLEITDVRPGRLQEITNRDCIAEGWPIPNINVGISPKKWFQVLWDSIYRHKCPWDSDPWVWRIAFQARGCPRSK